MLDENVPVKVVKALQAVIPIWHHDHRIEYIPVYTNKMSVPDSVWLPRLASEGWVLLTADRGKSNKGKKLPHLCRQHSLTHVLVGPSIHDLTEIPKLCAILAVWPELLEAASAEAGARFRLTRQAERIILDRVPAD